jgi:hypothetical protein
MAPDHVLRVPARRRLADGDEPGCILPRQGTYATRAASSDSSPLHEHRHDCTRARKLKHHPARGTPRRRRLDGARVPRRRVKAVERYGLRRCYKLPRLLRYCGSSRHFRFASLRPRLTRRVGLWAMPAPCLTKRKGLPARRHQQARPQVRRISTAKGPGRAPTYRR